VDRVGKSLKKLKGFVRENNINAIEGVDLSKLNINLSIEILNYVKRNNWSIDSDKVLYFKPGTIYTGAKEIKVDKNPHEKYKKAREER